MRDGWLKRDGVRLHWREWEPAEAATAPPLFCLHGLSSNSMYWARLAARFPHRRVVALDQRSHGLSDRPTEGYSFEELAADAKHAIAELGVERPLILGHSWGAAVALALAADQVDSIAGLAHLDGPLRSFSNLMSWDQASVVMQPPLKHYANLEEAFAEQRGYLEDGWAEDLQAFVEAGLIQDADGYALPLTAGIRLQILQALFDFDEEALWPRLAASAVLIAQAERAPAAIADFKRQSAEIVGQMLPSAEIKWYPSAHDIPLHLPDQLAADIEAVASRGAVLKD